MRCVLVDDKAVSRLDSAILHDVAFHVEIRVVFRYDVAVLQGQVIPGREHIDLAAV